MAKRRRKLSFRRDKSLPTDFSRDYVIAVRALSRQHKSAPEALKAVKLLKRMSREAFLAGRGEVWIPNPGPTTGHYPVIENLPFSKIRTALRKNTLKRERAWTAVAAATRPFYPQHSAISQMEKSLLPAIITSIPFVKGRSPALLGKRVPGELQMTRKGGSAIPIKGMSPDEWIQHGFQPLKFQFRPGLKRLLRKFPKVREVVSIARRAPREGAEMKLALRGAKEKRMFGTKGDVSVESAKKIVRGIAGKKQMVKIKPDTASGYLPGKRGRGRIIARPNAPIAAHEAGHAVQHRKLGRAFKPLLAGLPAAAPLAAAGVAAGSASKDKEKSWRKGTATGAALWAPRLVAEGSASLRGLKYPGGRRMMAAGLGSYLVGAATTSAIPAAMGKWVGGMKPPKQKKKSFTLEPIDALVYARGYQYGLRSFLQRHRVAEKLKRGALPAALGGLVLEGLRRAHTEIGIPPTTVDLVPVQRTTFKGEYAPYTNMQLRAFQNALEGKLPEAEEHTASEIKKQIGKIDIEIIGRRAV